MVFFSVSHEAFENTCAKHKCFIQKFAFVEKSLDKNMCIFLLTDTLNDSGVCTMFFIFLL